MMITTTYRRLVRPLALGAVVAALAAPPAALAGSGTTKLAPDWFERYAAAHPYGAATAVVPDWFERYAAAHPYGAATAVVPDWFERYAAAHPYGRGIAPGAVSVTDGRSPDTRDAAIIAHATTPAPSVIAVGNGGFNWRDAAIGAAGGFAIALLCAGALMLLRRGHGRLAL